MKNIKKAFTLIELLVVITIIGILATGAVATYTSQIQKARDTTRINDMKALEGGIEQIYQDKGAYPNTGAATSGLPGFTTITTYLPKLNADPKTGQKSGNSNFDYTYTVAADTNAIVGQIYEVSTSFENAGNLSEKAGKDGGSDGYRLEQGLSLTTLGTAINFATNAATWVASNPLTISATACIPRVLGTTAPTAGATSVAPVACAVTESTTNVNNQTLIIR